MNTQVNYLKAYCTYTTQKARCAIGKTITLVLNKWYCIKLICRCKENKRLYLIGTFADSLTKDRPPTAADKKDEPRFKTPQEIIKYLCE